MPLNQIIFNFSLHTFLHAMVKQLLLLLLPLYHLRVRDTHPKNQSCLSTEWDVGSPFAGDLSVSTNTVSVVIFGFGSAVLSMCVCLDHKDKELIVI